MAGARRGRRRSWQKIMEACGRWEVEEVTTGEDEDEDKFEGEDVSPWRQLRKVWAGLAGEEVDEGRAW
jgi:hypothetical protein